MNKENGVKSWLLPEFLYVWALYGKWQGVAMFAGVPWFWLLFPIYVGIITVSLLFVFGICITIYDDFKRHK